jgi:dihydrofolate reductase
MIIVDEIVSADGYAARSDGSIDFFVDRPGLVDSVGNAERMPRVSAVLLGARTYAEFAAHWPDQDPGLPVNSLPKHVLSRSLDEAPWGGMAPAVVESGDVVEVARRLAERYGGDLIVWGSLSVAEQLFAAGEVDELWLRVVPVAIGQGRSVFPPQDVALRSAEVAAHPEGWVTVRYEVSRPARDPRHLR